MDHNVPPTGEESISENNLNIENNMESLLKQEGMDIDFPAPGEIRSGVIASVTPGQILVSVGTKSEGVITGRELEAIPVEELENLTVGREILVYVINPEDQSGNIVLSYTRAREESSWTEADGYKDSGELFHGTVAGYNKGGLIVHIGELKGFVPSSQFSYARRSTSSGDSPDQRYSKMVGETIDVRVIEVDRERRRLILSERAASGETRESIKDRVLDELQVGDVCTGRVTSIADFGVFVNINGADGLVHLSEVSWDRIQKPDDIVKSGQEVKVKVISIDRDKKRIGLSMRRLQDDPFAKKIESIQVGQLLEGTITRLTKFGAFARLEDDIEGLIHISEISENRIEHPKEVLKEGEVVTVRVIKIDPENHRIGLSIRRVDSSAYVDLDWQSLVTDLDASVTDETGAAEAAAETATPEIPIKEKAAKPKSKAKSAKKSAEPETQVDMETPAPEAEVEPAAVEVAAEPAATEMDAEPAPAEVKTEPAATEVKMESTEVPPELEAPNDMTEKPEQETE
ncbi:MAG: S1 RNA-binding domain-containing protein [Anaerolineaceae bacterium]|nr:S1 RNA-binding domain-containing protein [Anaerolineaceae bacterium]MBN2677903.1 S1 RNA-binding domain-containing protein [Anaerolineaceae bacterium]